jgi:hypothetical protein
MEAKLMQYNNPAYTHACSKTKYIMLQGCNMVVVVARHQAIS